MAAGEMEVMLEVGGFDMDGGVELTMIHVYIDVQKSDLGGGGVPGEFDGIVAVDAFKELVEGVGTMRSKEKNVRIINLQFIFYELK